MFVINVKTYFNMNKQLKDFSWDELNELFSPKEMQKQGQRNGGKLSGESTLQNKKAIHNEKFRKEWQSMGGDASISKLLQWQIDNNFKVCDLERTEKWCNNISIALTGNSLSKKHKNNVKIGIEKYMKSLSKEEKSKKYSNNARANTARIKRIKILNSIRVDEFDSIRLRKACDRFEYDFDLLAKDKTLLERIYKGTNKTNPSIFKKLNK